MEEIRLTRGVLCSEKPQEPLGILSTLLIVSGTCLALLLCGYILISVSYSVGYTKAYNQGYNEGLADGRETTTKPESTKPLKGAKQ